MRFAPGVNWEFRHSSGIYLIAQPGSGKAPLRWKSILSALFLPAINHGAARRDARDAKNRGNTLRLVFCIVDLNQTDVLSLVAVGVRKSPAEGGRQPGNDQKNSGDLHRCFRAKQAGGWLISCGARASRMGASHR
jgi:hypothetical protein